MPLHVLIAPDKFKGTLTAREAAAAIARGWRTARPQDEVQLLPISDGGDGFGTVMSELLGTQALHIRTKDAAHRPHTATWWWESRTRTAIVESAGIIGLAMLPRGKFHPFELDTFGLGDVMRATTRHGAREILVGIGGSATNDGGFGLARALGWQFLDQAGNALKDWTDLPSLAQIIPPPVKFPALVKVAVDVQNPLLGPRGATRIYGPQKGIRPEEIAQAERCLRRLAGVMRKFCGADLAKVAGTGAAGGLGFGLKTFLGASLVPGFDLFAKRAGLLRRLRGVDLVITGEGSIDDSTVMGKGVGEVARACHARKIPCLGLAGRAVRTPRVQKMFQAVEGLTDSLPVSAALAAPGKHLTRLAEHVALAWPET